MIDRQGFYLAAGPATAPRLLLQRLQLFSAAFLRRALSQGVALARMMPSYILILCPPPNHYLAANLRMPLVVTGLSIVLDLRSILCLDLIGVIVPPASILRFYFFRVVGMPTLGVFLGAGDALATRISDRYVAVRAGFPGEVKEPPFGFRPGSRSRQFANRNHVGTIALFLTRQQRHRDLAEHVGREW